MKMPSSDSAFRKRWPFLAAVAVVLAVAVAVGSMFAANSSEQPIQEAVAAQAQPDLTDPGLYAEPRPPAAIMPETAITEPPEPDRDPGVNQVVPEGSGSLSRWLADRPDEMGPFSIPDAMAADSLDVEWMLYQAVRKDVMTESEADAFRAWFDQRPTVEEAPELLNHLPAQIYRPGDENNGSIKSY